MPKNPLIALPGYALRRASGAMMADLVARLAVVDLRFADAGVILLVAANPGITASAIGRELDIQRANLTRLLGKLEERGLVDRTPLNRKAQALRLTTEGERIAQEVQAIVEGFERDLLARIPEAHRAHLLPALQALWH